MSATDRLLKGYKHFLEEYYPENRDTLLQLATDGQSPKVCLISCCDSRVEPAIILHCDPGDLFVIRNVANLVPPCEIDASDESYHGTSAALEFAVNGLEVETIVVLGHAQCGGIKALMDRRNAPDSGSFIHKWMGQLTHIREKIYADGHYENQEERYLACEEFGIAQSLENLMTFPWIAERVKAGTLELHGWYYDIHNSELFQLNTESSKFEKITF